MHEQFATLDKGASYERNAKRILWHCGLW